METTKIQWIEKKYKQAQKENLKLIRKIKKLEQLSADRGIPAQMYIREKEWAISLIKDSLQGNSDSYQLFVQVGNPQSYNDLYYSILPELKRHFIMFARTIKNYLDFLNQFPIKGPIFVATINEYHETIRDKLQTVKQRFSHYRTLLSSSSWSVSLDEATKKIKKEILEWLESADTLSKNLELQLLPTDSIEKLAIGISEEDF